MALFFSTSFIRLPSFSGLLHVGFRKVIAPSVGVFEANKALDFRARNLEQPSRDIFVSPA